MARITLEAVTKRFGAVTAAEDLSLEIEDGSFLALLGPSGCGKSTVLRLIAGFERVTSGVIRVNGEVVSSTGVHLPPERRRVGIVFQSYALWPHMTVDGNVGYPLRVARVSDAEYRRRVDDALDMVGLREYVQRRPSELSGGQRQRVALARCMVMQPTLVLLDEPLANLDVHLRAAMEDEFRAFHAKTRATMVYVTHDQAEAMALAQTVAVMDRGRLVQIADPRTLYREPGTRMVAGFIGKGALADAEVLERLDGERCRARVFGAEVVLRCGPAQQPGPAQACLRPEELAFDASGVPATVRRVTYKGGTTEVEVAPQPAPETVLVLNTGEVPSAGAGVRIRVLDGWVIPRR